MEKRKHNLLNWALAVCLCLWILVGSAQALILYVDADEPPGQNGQTWANAFNNIQVAVHGF